jgi:uncharacterized membrane protein
MSDAKCEKNVGNGERLFSVLGGCVMVVSGLRRRNLRGAVSILMGGASIYRGASGHCSLYAALDISTCDVKQHKEALLQTSTDIQSTPPEEKMLGKFQFSEYRGPLTASMPSV